MSRPRSAGSSFSSAAISASVICAKSCSRALRNAASSRAIGSAPGAPAFGRSWFPTAAFYQARHVENQIACIAVLTKVAIGWAIVGSFCSGGAKPDQKSAGNGEWVSKFKDRNNCNANNFRTMAGKSTQNEHLLPSATFFDCWALRKAVSGYIGLYHFMIRGGRYGGN